jgi:CubicO group peptidase (beta-lactamase class C family)
MDFVQAQISFDIHSLLIIRNGYIVADATFYPFAQGHLHDLASVTKSFMSTLIGIAIDQGYIESVEQPVLDFFPDRTVANLDANKGAMTLEDLLTMRSGFECNEDVTSQMLPSPDWVQFALDLPMVAEPGTLHSYCDPNSHLLSAILQNTTGMSALAYAQEQLFGPLGVSDVSWSSDPQGRSFGAANMRLTPHDMAKLGYLFLNEGLWDGQQVVSAAWVETATSALTQDSSGYVDYGYQWWVDPSGAYYEAAGYGGQKIHVLPEREMIVVMTGASGRGSGEWGERLLENYIIPSAESTAPLPPNPDGVAALESRIQDAAAPAHVQPEPVPPMPEMAQRVAGIPYLFDDNPFGALSMALSFPAHDEALLRVTTTGEYDDPEFEWLMGMDNVDRMALGRYDLLTSAKGWWESANVFVAQVEEVAYRGRKLRVNLVFEGDRVSVEMWDDGTPAGTLTGRAEE